MRLVDRRHRQIRLREKIERAIGEQSLGRDVEQLQFAVGDAICNALALAWRHRAVDARGGHAVGHERVDLVLHQRDQRRNDEREPIAHERGRLITKRLATAGRQHDDRIASLDAAEHRLALQREKGIVAPIFFEDRR